MKERYGGSNSIIFVCPYGFLQKPSLSDADRTALRDHCEHSGIRYLQIDTEVTTGRLVCAYKNLNPIFSFVLDQKTISLAGRKFIMYEVVVPDLNAPMINLMPGVSLLWQERAHPSQCFESEKLSSPFGAVHHKGQ